MSLGTADARCFGESGVLQRPPLARQPAPGSPRRPADRAGTAPSTWLPAPPPPRGFAAPRPPPRSAARASHSLAPNARTLRSHQLGTRSLSRRVRSAPRHCSCVCVFAAGTRPMLARNTTKSLARSPSGRAPPGATGHTTHRSSHPGTHWAKAAQPCMRVCTTRHELRCGATGRRQVLVARARALRSASCAPRAS